MNIAILMGRMTRDPELRYTSSGKAYANFTLAVQKTKDEAEFIDCMAWEKTAETIAEYFRKGNRILINGKIVTSTYESNGEKRKSVKVQAFNFEFIDSKNSGNNQNSNRNNYDDDEPFPFDQGAAGKYKTENKIGENMSNNNVNNLIYDLHNIAALDKYIHSDESELDEQDVKDAEEDIRFLLEEKSEVLELKIRELESDEKKCKEIADFYNMKAKKREDKRKKLKEKIFETMKILKAKKIETPTGAFTIKNNPASLIIDDKNLIPARFIKIEQVDKIEKAEIKKAIKNGEEIAGVHLETSQSLLIR